MTDPRPEMTRAICGWTSGCCGGDPAGCVQPSAPLAGENSPVMDDAALAADLAADPAIAASLAEWERTSGPLSSEYSLDAWLNDAMLTLVQCGVPTDVQTLLMEGDGRGGVAPGAMAKAVKAAVKVALSDAAYAVLLVHNARIARGRGGFTSQAMMECQDAIKGIAR
jgi:NADPH-dependent ferric siderophore reductase